MTIQGINLKKFMVIGGFLLILLVGVYFYSLNNSYMLSFLSHPLVSFLGWLVSICAGLIAIFEFSSYKKVKKEYEELKVEYNNRITNVSGQASYFEKVDGGVNISHGGGDE